MGAKWHLLTWKDLVWPPGRATLSIPQQGLSLSRLSPGAGAKKRLAQGWAQRACPEAPPSSSHGPAEQAEKTSPYFSCSVSFLLFERL